MKIAKKLFAAALLFALISPIVGCGIGTTQADNQRAFARVVDHDARMLVDDLALFAQTKRPLRNSRWIID